MRTILMNGEAVATLADGDDMFAMIDNVQREFREFREWEYIEVEDASGKTIFAEANPDAN